jgi:hypothetical protein
MSFCEGGAARISLSFATLDEPASLTPPISGQYRLSTAMRLPRKKASTNTSFYCRRTLPESADTTPTHQFGLGGYERGGIGCYQE